MDGLLKEIGRMERASQQVLANLEKMPISTESDADLLRQSLRGFRSRSEKPTASMLCGPLKLLKFSPPTPGWWVF